MLQKIKNTAIFWFLRALLAAVSCLPMRLARWLGAGMGALFHACVKRERDLARSHLQQAFPEWTPQACAVMAKRVFVSLGRTAMEFLKMNSYSPQRILSLVEGVDGREHMEAALTRGKGVVCLVAHVGNWELLPVFTSQQGWSTAVVAQKLYDPRLDALLNGFRTRSGVQVLKRDNITTAIIRCLRANKLLGILNDQDTDVDSRWAPFFGRLAKTPVGILRLARRTGAAVVPVFTARQPGGGNRITILPALSLPLTQDEEADLQEGARQCNQVIEDFIRRYPDQWVWFHRRWKSQPPA
jgi:KDO2-lipid IV(A) lauroyltransferase